MPYGKGSKLRGKKMSNKKMDKAKGSRAMDLPRSDAKKGKVGVVGSMSHSSRWF